MTTFLRVLQSQAQPTKDYKMYPLAKTKSTTALLLKNTSRFSEIFLECL